MSKLIRQWQGRQEVLPTWCLVFDLQSKGLEFIGREVKPVSYGSREDENLSSVMVSGHMFKAGLLLLFSLPPPLNVILTQISGYLPCNYYIFLYDSIEG